MASEIRVNKIENRSGLGTVTFADTGVDLAGIVTATTFSGSGASLTNVPDSALSAVTASKIVGVHTSLTVTNATTTGTAVVGGGVTISESGIEASGIGITCANINGTQIGGRRNIIINGAMNVAQRGTSSTSSGFYTVDRVRAEFTGTDEAPTQAQVDVTSGTSPYTEGFRKALKITNGNQTSGAGAADFVRIRTNHEGSSLATSGWNYTSSSSFITVQFWVRSSVAQTYQAYLRSMATTSQIYVWEFALSANTWTKVIKTIPGNSNIVFDNNNQNGLEVSVLPFMGTNYTTASPTLNAWGAFDGGDSRKDMTSTWYTTNDATFEFTGFQLEVGSQATPFEHRSFAEELALCQRYFYRHGDLSGTRNYALMGVGMIGHNGSTDTGKIQISSPVRMRTQPTATAIPSGAEFIISTGDGGEGTSDMYCNSAPALWTAASGDMNFWVDFQRTSGGSPDQGIACLVYANNNGANMGFDAEL